MSRKELILCDEPSCKHEIETSDDGKVVFALTIAGKASASGTEAVRVGLTRSIQGNLQIIEPGEYCSKACLLKSLRGQVEQAEERIRDALR